MVVKTKIVKSIFFWDMTPCSALSGTRRFGGMNEWMDKGEANYGPYTATLKIYCASPSTSPLQQPHTSDEV
jgi:hypothetical protein